MTIEDAAGSLRLCCPDRLWPAPIGRGRACGDLSQTQRPRRRRGEGCPLQHGPAGKGLEEGRFRGAQAQGSGGIAQGLGRGARYGRATAARHPERTAAHMCAVIAAAKGERRTNALSSAISVPPSSSGWHRRPGPSSAVSRLLGRTSRGCATPFTAPVLGCHKAIG